MDEKLDGMALEQRGRGEEKEEKESRIVLGSTVVGGWLGGDRDGGWVDGEGGWWRVVVQEWPAGSGGGRGGVAEGME